MAEKINKYNKKWHKYACYSLLLQRTPRSDLRGTREPLELWNNSACEISDNKRDSSYTWRDAEGNDLLTFQAILS